MERALPRDKRTKLTGTFAASLLVYLFGLLFTQNLCVITSLPPSVPSTTDAPS